MGYLTALLGANGSGKTTLLKCGMRTASKPLRYRQGVRPGAAVVQTPGAGGLYQLYPSEKSVYYIISERMKWLLWGPNPRLNWYEAPSSAHREEARRLLEQIGLGMKRTGIF